MLIELITYVVQKSFKNFQHNIMSEKCPEASLNKQTIDGFCHFNLIFAYIFFFHAYMQSNNYACKIITNAKTYMFLQSQ